MANTKAFEHKIFKKGKICLMETAELVVDLKEYLMKCEYDVPKKSLTYKLKEILKDEDCMYNGFKKILDFAKNNKTKFFSTSRIDKLLKFARRRDVVKYCKWLDSLKSWLDQKDVDKLLNNKEIAKDPEDILTELGIFYQEQDKAEKVINKIKESDGKGINRKGAGLDPKLQTEIQLARENLRKI